ncbi:hypothetical protein GCM10010441_72490 [Kitasatospora paracochleata]|uniref:hypothetical protein n=1 Tax=Kitasatospora paracochleata TaxID=58354 RepID=UPI0031D77DD0
MIYRLCDVYEGASEARTEDNPALAGDLARRLGSALSPFSTSDASDAVITRWMG